MEYDDLEHRSHMKKLEMLDEAVDYKELLKKYMTAVQKEDVKHMWELESTEVFQTMSHEELVVLWDLESEIHNGAHQ